MNKKNLAIKLSKLTHLTNLKINLEQYQTESELAAFLLWRAYQDSCIKNKVVADFGCGNGIFGIGALLLGAKFVYFLDSDEDALNTCKNNLLKFYSGDNYSFILGDVSIFKKNIDTVIMNPPFGVQKRKADKRFLESAMKNSDVIYSIHKIQSKKFIEALCSENNFSVVDIVEIPFVIKKTYKFHTRARYSFISGIWILKRKF